MCGIVGIINKDGRGLFEFHKEIIRELLVADAVRGWDSTGVFGVSLENNIHIVKQAVDPGIFFRSEAYKRWSEKIPNYRVAIGHNRKATTGAVTSANAHPFKEGDITLVHNGSVFDHKVLNAEVDVDSHALCHSFASKGAIETIKSVRGAFALIWYNWKEQALYMWRNKERPLWLCEKTNDLYVASERGMLEWIMTREGREHDKKEFRPVLPDTLYKITFSPFVLTKESLYEKPFTTPPDYLTNGYSGLQHGPMCDLETEQESSLAALEQNLEPSAPDNEEDLMQTSEIIKEYPFNSQVLFNVDKLETFTDGPKRWRLKGKIFLPGKSVHNGFLYPPDELTEFEVRKMKDARRLTARIKVVMNKRGDTVIHLKDPVIPDTIATFNNIKYPRLEWERICNDYTCHQCKKSLGMSTPALTSINPNEATLGVYKVTCSKCVTESIPADKRADVIARRSPAV